MSRCPLLSLLLLLATSPATASSIVLAPPRPVSGISYSAAGDESERAVAVANGDRVLVAWNRAEGAVRLDEDGKPLDVPAIHLPRPPFVSGADVVADGDGWLVGWTTFTLGDQSATLRLARVTYDGDVDDVRDVPLSLVVDQNVATHLAKRGRVLVTACQMAGLRVAIAAASNVMTVDGELRELIATSEGFALLLHDRMVVLDSAGTRVNDIALPTGFNPSDLRVIGTDLIVAGTQPGSVVLLRVRETPEILVQIPVVWPSRPRVGVKDGEALLIWNAAPQVPVPYSYPSWDLHAARVRSDGTVEGPRQLREKTDFTGRWVGPVDLPLVEPAGDNWIAIWSEGFRYPSILWRNLYSATLSEPLGAIGKPTLTTYRAPDQNLFGTALFNDVLLTVWHERAGSPFSDPIQMFAARTRIDGSRIDPDRVLLGTFSWETFKQPLVLATDQGFLLISENGQIRLGVEGPPIVEAAPAPIRDIACAQNGCIAVWIDGLSILFAEWRDGALVTPPAPLYHSYQLGDLDLSTNGTSFLLAFARGGDPAGTILAATHIEKTTDGWTHHTSDFAASKSQLGILHLVRTADRYLALWRVGYVGHRASHLTFEGASMDGAETGWEGWPVEGANLITDSAFDGKHTVLLGAFNAAQRLYELRGRTAIPVATVDSSFQSVASIECTQTAGCAYVDQKDVEGDPWFRSKRLFMQPFAFARPRAVRH